MTGSKIILDAAANFEAPVFHPVLADAGAGRTFTMLGTTMRLIAPSCATGGRYTVLEQITPPGWGPPRHIHSREDEIFYVLEGAYDLHVGEERRAVSAGASVVLPRHVPTAFGTQHRSRAACFVSLLPADSRNIS